MTDLYSFYNGKRVLVTGHTGFKGTWLTKILLNFGAVVMGYSIDFPTKPCLYDISGIESESNLTSIIGDVRDLNKLKKVFNDFCPEIVFHLAAQPIVRYSYKDPVNTYSTNVMGTVNVLECIRNAMTTSGEYMVKSFLNVTTDKVYKNREWCWGYREDELLDGFDPYSNSKSCSELVTHSYKDSFFRLNKKESGEYDYAVAISTARAGNVIGGGDFANDRIIPDCIRTLQEAIETNNSEAIIQVRNPNSTRPYQHVLEPLFAYLIIAEKQYNNRGYAGYYNVGPDDCDCLTTGELVDLFCNKWNTMKKERDPFASWNTTLNICAPHEANFLKLDTSKIKSTMDWKPILNISEAVEQTIKFSIKMLQGDSIADEMTEEINYYISKLN